MAAPLLNTYSSQDVIMVWGPIPMQAYADSFVNVSFVEDQTASTQTPDAYVGRSILPSTMGTIEITLQQNSPTHELLTAVLAAQKESRIIENNTFLITDLNGNSLYTGINACIQGAPTISYGKTHEDGLRTWTFLAADLKLLG